MESVAPGQLDETKLGSTNSNCFNFNYIVTIGMLFWKLDSSDHVQPVHGASYDEDSE